MTTYIWLAVEMWTPGLKNRIVGQGAMRVMHLVNEEGPFGEMDWLCEGIGDVFERTPWNHERLCVVCRNELGIRAMEDERDG